jgi:hypothetical protein
MTKNPRDLTLPSRRRAPSSVSLVIVSLLLALVAVMAMPVVTYWAGGTEGEEVDLEVR